MDKRLAAMGMVLGLAMLSRAAILIVNPLSNNLQAALDASQPGDTVLVQPGHYHGHFLAPAHDILVTSRHLLDPDTSFINQTILDGDLTGTVLTVPEGGHWFRLNGVTVTGGLRRHLPDVGAAGGGLFIQRNVNLDVRNTVFTRNDSEEPTNAGVAMFGGIYPMNDSPELGEVILENIQITNNGHEGTAHYAPAQQDVLLAARGPVHATRIFCNGAGRDDGALFLRALDSLVVRDLRISGYQSELNPISSYSLCSLEGQSVMDLADIRIRDNHSSGGTCLSVNAWLADLHLRNLEVVGNTDSLVFDHDDTVNYYAFLEIQADTCTLDSVLFQDNARIGNMLLWLRAKRGGTVHALEMLDNRSGSDSQYTNGYKRMVDLQNIGLTDSRFLRNRMEMPISPFPGGVSGPSMVECWNQAEDEDPDSLVWRNVVFQDNQVIEHTLPSDKRRGIIGRTLFMGGLRKGHMVFQDCQWIGNHTNLIAPEVDNWMDYRNVGSTVELTGIYPSHGNLVVENCLFEDNDDGGLWANEFGRGRVSNCRFIDVDRFALIFQSGSDASDIEIDNVYVNGTNAQLAFLPYSQTQGVMTLTSHSSLVLKNTTITNCNTPFVCDLGDPFWDAEGLVTNCSFSNLQYREFVSTGEPSEETWPGNFQYCMSEASLPGQHNLVASPGFDPHLGPPFLTADSPCIDAGDPDPAFNDVEDPALPGFPLWPALGSLRNDIGFTGGPHAVALDTSYVSVPHWEPATPKDFRLGAAYPNPFNPTTTIELAIPVAGEYQLRLFNVLGQQVQVLQQGSLQPGLHRVLVHGEALSSGLYVVQAEGPQGVRQEKVMLLK